MYPADVVELSRAIAILGELLARDRMKPSERAAIRAAHGSLQGVKRFASLTPGGAVDHRTRQLPAGDR